VHNGGSRAVVTLRALTFREACSLAAGLPGWPCSSSAFDKFRRAPGNVVSLGAAVQDGTVNGWRVLGVDSCKSGWIGIALSEGAVSAYTATEIDGLVEEAAAGGPVAVVAVDIPIGLPDTGRRQADVLARKAVGPRWPSVFMTPVRPALEAADYATAADLSRRLSGEGISSQAFALQAKILQVDRWVRDTPHRVVEVHPEASFAELARAALQSRKSSWAGAILRRRLLAGAGINLPDDLGLAGEKAAVDDVLDAAAAAWTALRVLRGQARSTPSPPELFNDGLPSAIWT
jgi:predicted RNase H-like nuclease